jgi:hypothetical protein
MIMMRMIYIIIYIIITIIIYYYNYCNYILFVVIITMMIVRFADGTGTIVLGIIPKWRKIFRLVKYDMMATPKA